MSPDCRVCFISIRKLCTPPHWTLQGHHNRLELLRSPIHRLLFQYCERVSNICDVLRDLVPFVQSKKHEKHLWKSVTFIKVAGF